MQRRLVVIPLAVAIGAAILTAPLVFAQLGLDSTTRFVPGPIRLVHVFELIALGAPIIHAILLATAGRRALGSLSSRSRWSYLVGTMVLQVGVALASLAATFNTDPHGFGGELIGSAPSPEHGRTGYLYTAGVICGLEVYVARDGDPIMRQVGFADIECDDQRAAYLRWSDNDTLDVRDHNGQVKSGIPASVAR